jgi:hypothetical protein
MQNQRRSNRDDDHADSKAEREQQVASQRFAAERHQGLCPFAEQHETIDLDGQAPGDGQLQNRESQPGKSVSGGR